MLATGRIRTVSLRANGNRFGFPEFGIDAGLVGAIPDNEIGDGAIAELRQFGNRYRLGCDVRADA